MIRIQFPEFFRSAILVIYAFVTALPVTKVNRVDRIENSNDEKEDPRIDRVDCEVLYDPPPGMRRGDIIIIHGLHGSTSKTWRQGVYESSKIKKTELRRHLSVASKVPEKQICAKCKLLKKDSHGKNHQSVSERDCVGDVDSSESDDDASFQDIGDQEFESLEAAFNISDKIKECLNENMKHNDDLDDDYIYDALYDKYISDDDSSDDTDFQDKNKDNDIQLTNAADPEGDIPEDICDSKLDVVNNFKGSTFDVDDDGGGNKTNCDSCEGVSLMDRVQEDVWMGESATREQAYNRYRRFFSFIKRENRSICNDLSMEDKNDFCICNKIEISTGYIDKRVYEEHLKYHIYGTGSLLLRECIIYIRFLINVAKQLYSLYRKLWDYSDDKSMSDCWPKDWLPKDCPYARVIAINYTTFLWMPIWYKSCNRTSLMEKSLEMAHQLENLGVGKQPIVWAAHSKGGLFIKQIFINSWRGYNGVSKDLFLNTHTMVFYSVPHHGSVLAHLFTPPLVRPSVEIVEIRTGSKIVQALHSEFCEALEAAHGQDKNNSIPIIISYTETIPTNMSGVLLQIVFPMSADPGVGEFYGIALDHRMICKFPSRDSMLYKDLVSYIERAYGQNECV